jgi:fructosamine-3-kinase
MQNLIPHLEQETGQPLKNPRLTSVGGGDINSAYKLQAEGVIWFIKLNRADLQDMFAAEAAGLEELAATGTVRAPAPLWFGRFQRQAYLVMEFIDLKSSGPQGLSLFGRQLAQLHRLRQPWFGWGRDNTIGSTPQFNTKHADWVEFWRKERLGRQLQFAAENGYIGALQSRGERLLARLDSFFTEYQPQPALLHGDLWGGNVAADSQGNPVLFDPACYYGDREADIAMTELFGGFCADFYAAYQEEYPLDVGYKTRKTLYNLYHILNHLNLFGSGYLGQAKGMIESLLAELG